MAKIRHRVFEIYESFEEASREIAPKSEKTPTESSAPESWSFKHLNVSRSAGVTCVRFREASNLSEAIAELRSDFAELAGKLGMDSKVLVDFSGVETFSAASIDALVEFSRKLRTKGSRIALCCLVPSARESFFLPDDRDRSQPSL